MARHALAELRHLEPEAMVLLPCAYIVWIIPPTDYRPRPARSRLTMWLTEGGNVSPVAMQRLVHQPGKVHGLSSRVQRRSAKWADDTAGRRGRSNLPVFTDTVEGGFSSLSGEPWQIKHFITSPSAWANCNAVGEHIVHIAWSASRGTLDPLRQRHQCCRQIPRL